jgi:hypothetical protein
MEPDPPAPPVHPRDATGPLLMAPFPGVFPHGDALGFIKMAWTWPVRGGGQQYAPGQPAQAAASSMQRLASQGGGQNTCI